MVNIGKSKVVMFGGLVDKKFLSDIVVFDVGTIFSFLFLILTLFLICVFLIIFSNSLDLAFWVFLILREGRKPKNI